MQDIPLRYIYGINLNAEYDQSVTGAVYSVNNFSFNVNLSKESQSQSMASLWLTQGD